MNLQHIKIHSYIYCMFAYRVTSSRYPLNAFALLYSVVLALSLSLSGFCFVRFALSSFRTLKLDGRVASSCRLLSWTRVAFAVAVAVAAAATAWDANELRVKFKIT